MMSGSWDGQVAGALVRTRRVRWTLVATMLSTALLCSALARSASAGTGSMNRFGYALALSKTVPYTPCPPGGQMIECNIIVDPPAIRTALGYQLPGGGPLLEGGGELGGFDPADLQSAYKIPATGGSGQTVALIEAYGYKEAESDLAKYREKYGLSACTKANGCFKRVNQKGEEANYPAEGGGLEIDWTLETALDMDMISAACPSCHITVVEANTQEPKDTAAAAAEAVAPAVKATEISNSYGYPENNETYCPAKKGCAEYLSSYNHAGVPVTVSSGDSGYDNRVGAPEWPASSPNVIAVGGTSLYKAEDTRGWTETTWAGSGGGCSLFETKSAWQIDTGCAKRLDNDVSAVADPHTPLSVYNTPASKGWVDVGGTSASAPLVAGIEAHAEAAAKNAAAEAFYKHPGMLFDVASGANGRCTPPAENAYLCTAGVGYDGPTGWGTPDGVPHLSGWFSRVVPNVSAETYANSVLTGVSCMAVNSCIAVGHYLNVATETPLIEHWDGVANEWKSVFAPAPAGAKSAGLVGVSCVLKLGLIGIVEYCVALGRYTNGSGAEMPFVDAWNMEVGPQWEVQTIPLPAGAKSGSLSGAWCAGEGTCFVVGRYTSSAGTEQTLAEGEFGASGAWAISATPNPSGAKSSSLTGVSCVETTACKAVGSYVNSTGVEVTLAEHFSAEKWAITTTHNPVGAKSSSLTGVSCPSTCVAVGHYVNSAGTELTLAEISSGEELVIQESPNPTGAQSATLAGVACHAAETCSAVGWFVSSAGREETLAEVFTTTTKKWAVQESANPTGAKSSSLAAISCTAAEACTTVGHYVDSVSSERTLGEVFTAATKKWAIAEVATPKLPSGDLAGVSCTSTEACTAAGFYRDTTNVESTLAERWNGKEWSRQETPNPSGALANRITSVSCAAAEACTAVGHYVTSAGEDLALGEVWSSKKWTVQEIPRPAEARNSELKGVSCTAAEACTAVGFYYSLSGSLYETLAEVFTSATKKWAVKESPNPSGSLYAELSGVSCTAAETCTAVGRYFTSGVVEETLAEVFTAATKKWTIQATPNPSGAKSAALSGVSCTAAEACTAVGHYVTSGGVEETLAEVFTSATKKWTIQETPNPTGATRSGLAGVSCVEATACTAVGFAIVGSVEVALAEALTAGKWTVQEVPNPEGKGGFLAGVSCKSATACIATGDENTNLLTEAALVEEHA